MPRQAKGAPGINRVRKKLANGSVRETHYAGRGKGAHVIFVRTSPPDPKHDSPYAELSPGYLAALNHQPQRKKGDKVADAVLAFRQSAEFLKLSDRTRDDYRKYLEAVVEEFGPDPVAVFNDSRIRQDVYEWRDRAFKAPRSRDYAVTVLALLLRWLRDRGVIEHFHLDKMKRVYKSDRAQLVWTPPLIERFNEAARRMNRAYMIHAMAFGCAFGLRISDAVQAGPQHVIERDGLRFLAYRTSKRGRVATPQIVGAGALVIDATPQGAETFLRDARGKPWSQSLYFSRQFTETARAAGVERLTFEDTRGTAATNLFLSGMDLEDIGGWMGWSPAHTVSIIQHYIALVPEIAVERRVRQLSKGVRVE